MMKRRCSSSPHESQSHEFHLINEVKTTETELIDGTTSARRVDYLTRRFYCVYCRDIVTDKEKVEIV